MSTKKTLSSSSKNFQVSNDNYSYLTLSHDMTSSGSRPKIRSIRRTYDWLALMSCWEMFFCFLWAYAGVRFALFCCLYCVPSYCLWCCGVISSVVLVQLWCGNCSGQVTLSYTSLGSFGKFTGKIQWKWLSKRYFDLLNCSSI